MASTAISPHPRLPLTAAAPMGRDPYEAGLGYMIGSFLVTPNSQDAPFRAVVIQDLIHDRRSFQRDPQPLWRTRCRKPFNESIKAQAVVHSFSLLHHLPFFWCVRSAWGSFGFEFTTPSLHSLSAFAFNYYILQSYHVLITLRCLPLGYLHPLPLQHVCADSSPESRQRIHRYQPKRL